MAKTTFRDLPDIEDKTLFLVMDGDNNLTGDPATIDRMMERKETTEVRIIRLLARSAESEEIDDSEDEDRPKVKLTVEEILPENAEEELKTGDSAVPPDFVDPLSQLDTEQVLKLKRALASEQAKQLLGDNVTAMLDVLSVDDSPAAFLQNSIRRDHCYTPLSPSADPRGASFVLPGGGNDPNAKKTKGQPKADSSKPSGSGLSQLIKPSVATPVPSQSSDIEEENANSDDSSDDTSEDSDSDDRDRSSDSDYRENSSSGLRGRKKGGRGPWGSRRMRGGIRGRKSFRGRRRNRLDHEEIASEVVETSKVHSNSSSDPPTSPALKRGRPRKSEVAVKSVAITTSTPEPSVVIPIDHVAAKVYSADAIRLGRPQVRTEEDRKRDMARIMHKLDAKTGIIKPKIASSGTVLKADKLQFKVIAISNKKPPPDDQLSQIETLEGDLQDDPPSMIKVAGKLHRTYVRKDESNSAKKASDVLTETATPKDTLKMKVPVAGNVMGGKYPRRENRKLPSHFADTIGPELFSSPDIARKRVQTTEESNPNKSKIAGKVVQKSLLKYVVKSSSPNRNPEMPVESAVPSDENIESVPTLTPGDSHSESASVIESMPVEGEILEAQSLANGPVTNKHQPKTEKGTINENAKPHLDKIKGDKIILGKHLKVRRQSSTKSENVDTETKKSSSNKNESESDNVHNELPEKSVLSPKDDVKPKKSDILEQKSSRRTSKDAKPSSRHEKVLSKPVESKPIVENSHKIVRADIIKLGSSKVMEAATPLTQEEVIVSPTEDRRRNAVKRRRSDEVSDLDSDTDDTLSEASWNSEDDPERLWCICRKPHNNRFMICCDLCEDWFHGKCVGITKSIGKQMEQDGLEWTCPPCAKKKQAEEKEKESKTNKGPEMKQTKLSGFSIKRPSVEGNERKCIMCKGPVRETSIYCSDKCIQSHSLKAIAQLGSANKTSSKADAIPVSTNKPDRHVIVMDPVSKKVLAGSSAPTLKNLATWLKDNPSYHVLYQKRTNADAASSNVKEEKKMINDKKMIQLPPSNKSSGEKSTQSKLLVSPNSKHIKIISRPAGSQPIQIIPAGSMKKSTTVRKPTSSSSAEAKSKTSESTKTSEKKEVETPKKSHRRRKEKHTILSEFKSPPSSSSKMEDREKSSGTGEQVIRDSVRKTLCEALKVRKTDCADLKTKEIDIESLATKIEERLYKLFDNKVDVKYKSKYRSLVFNIKDVKNQTLYRKILENSISPKELVRLTADEMASQELAQWREKENQHQLEMIKKTELELMALGQTFILKSHKGEEVIEKDQKVAAVAAALDPNTSAKELVSAINSVTSTTPDPAGEKEEAKGSETSLMKMNKKEKERRREKERKHKRDRSRSRSSRHSKRRKKSRSRSKDRHRRSSKSRSSRDSRDKDKDKDKPKDKGEKGKESITNAAHIEEEPVEISTSADVETKFKEIVSDNADYEPTSTVSIKTPETFPEEQDDMNELASVWAGQIIMPEIAKFHGIALEASGDCTNVDTDVSDQVSVVGRIPFATVWEYIERMRKMAKDILVVQILPIDIDVDKAGFNALFNYLSKRSRIAVIGRCREQVKDFYLYPHIRGTPLPEIINSVTIPSPKDSEQILLGIIIKSRRSARSAAASVSSLPLPPVVMPQRPKLPLPLPKSPIAVPEPAIISPPEVESTNTDPRKRKIKVHVEVAKSPSPAAVDEGDSPYSPASSDDDLPPLSKLPRKAASIKTKPPINLPASDGSIAAAAQIQKKIEEMNRAIEEETKQIKNLASSALHAAVNPSLASALNVNVPPAVPQLDLAFKALQTIAASKDLATSKDKVSESVQMKVPAIDTERVELDIPLPPSPPHPSGIGMEGVEKGKDQQQSGTPSGTTSTPLLLPEVAQISISNLQDILANINKQSKAPMEKVASSPPLSPKSPEPLPPGVDDSEIPKLPVKTKPDRSVVFEGDGVLAFTPPQKKPIKFDFKIKSRDLDDCQIVDIDERNSAPISSLDRRIAMALDQDERVISSVSSISDRDERFKSADLSAITSRDKDERLSRFSSTSDRGDRGFQRQDRWKNDSHKRRADRNSRESKWKDDLEDEWSGSIRRHEDEARRRSRSIRAKEIQRLKHNADHNSD